MCHIVKQNVSCMWYKMYHTCDTKCVTLWYKMCHNEVQNVSYLLHINTYKYIYIHIRKFVFKKYRTKKIAKNKLLLILKIAKQEKRKKVEKKSWLYKKTL